MTQFIAIDGEGLDRDGRHDYVLLAASDGTYVECLEPGGLSTRECLDYLLSLRGALVGFFISYDVNMILRDLTQPHLMRLWIDGETRWTPPLTDGFTYSYRIRWIPAKIFEVARGYWYKHEDGLERWQDEHVVTVYDVYGFFQKSFVATLAEWGVATADELAVIDAMKQKRAIFTSDGMTDIRNYCILECRLLERIMSQLDAVLRDVGISLQAWYGAGAVANYLFARWGIHEHVVPDAIDTPYGHATMSAYFGGRIETFAIGHFAEVYEYDIRSAYPHAMTMLPSLSGATWTHHGRYDASLNDAIWRVSWQCNREDMPTPFPVRHNKHVYWPYNGSGWYHAIEVAAAVALSRDIGWDITVHEGWALNPATETRPFERHIPAMYRKRAELKRAGNRAEYGLKLGLNSGYGKMAQSRGAGGKWPRFRSYYWAGRVTATCRAQILGAIGTAVRSGARVVAVATDAIFVDSPIPLPIGDEMGQWEGRKIQSFLVLQPGVYVSQDESVRKTRGFSRKHLRYADALNIWREHGIAGELTVRDTRFVGMGLALALNDMQLWRTWQTYEKRVAMCGTGTKSPDYASPFASSDVLGLLAPPSPCPISEPYRIREKLSYDELVEMTLAESGAYDQPDMIDSL